MLQTLCLSFITTIFRCSSFTNFLSLFILFFFSDHIIFCKIYTFTFSFTQLICLVDLILLHFLLFFFAFFYNWIFQSIEILLITLILDKHIDIFNKVLRYIKMKLSLIISFDYACLTKGLPFFWDAYTQRIYKIAVKNRDRIIDTYESNKDLEGYIILILKSIECPSWHFLDSSVKILNPRAGSSNPSSWNTAHGTVILLLSILLLCISFFFSLHFCTHNGI